MENLVYRIRRGRRGAEKKSHIYIYTMATVIIPHNGTNPEIHKSIVYPTVIDNIEKWITDISVEQIIDDITMKTGKLGKEMKVKSNLNQKTYTYDIDTPVRLITKNSKTQLFLPPMPIGSLRGGRRQTNRRLRKTRRNKTRK